jgi:hypothetical protein
MRVYWFCTMNTLKAKTLKPLAFCAATCLLAASTASADVHLTMQNGRVSIVAKDATLRQILTEWARIGQTKIVNVERIPGGPVSLELNNVTEAQALDVLLRPISGYIAAPRPVEAEHLSRFDRIIIMPTLAGARAPVVASTTPPPVFQQAPQFYQPPPVADDDDDQRPTPNVAVPNQSRGPVFNTFPQPQILNPQTGVPVGQPMTVGGAQTPNQPSTPTTLPPSAFPTAPFGGVAIPGMVAPPPPQQPGQLGAPGQPVRRPGGQ